MKRRLQHKVAESTATLPVACVVTAMLWWWPQGGYSLSYLLGLLSCALTTYVMMEMNAIYALLRIRSRMVSSLFVLLMAGCGFLHPISAGSIILLCVAIAYFFLLRTYEHPHPENATFHAYLLLSLGSLAWPPLLLLTPVLLWIQGVFLRAMRWNVLCAAFMGLVLPYVLWGTALTGWMVFSFLTTPLTETPVYGLAAFEPLLQHMAAIIAPFQEPLAWPPTTTFVYWWQAHRAEGVAFAFMVLLGLTGFIHYVRKSFDDKIRVRMCHYSFLLMQVILLVWLLLQPHLFPQLFPLFLFTTVPSTAHFVALTRTWFSNAWFLFLTLLLIAVAVITLTD